MRKRKTKSPRIIIAGANFAGIEAALAIPSKYQVTVIDPRPFFEFTPNIHELVSKCKKPHQLRQPKDRIILRNDHEFLEDAVTEIDPVKSIVTTRSGIVLDFDFLLMAAGGAENTYGIPGANQWAMPFKTVSQCHGIGVRLKRLMETQSSVSIAIIGGGVTGIEALGEILRRYRTFSNLEIHMIEEQDNLLPETSPATGREVQRICQSYPVVIHTNKSVTNVEKKRIILDGNEKLPADITQWTGGLQPSPLLKQSGLQSANDAWAPVDATLKSSYFDNIFIAGDAAGLPVPVTKQAYHAIDMGKCAGKNIIRVIEGKPLHEFEKSSNPMVVSFGDLDGYVISNTTVLAGAALSTLKETVYQIVMVQYDPGSHISRIPGLVGRAGRSAWHLATAHLTSFASLKRLPHVRLL